MPRINVLPKNIADLIAAGEVVERPASVIKEFVENSIDAGAKKIIVEIQNGGKTYMRVTDDGCGIEHEDVRKAFISHATSKISSVSDLDAISTLGFRGEALASVCAVAKVEMLTSTKGAEVGTRYVIEGGEEKLLDDVGAPVGTTIVVRDLFFNIPARLKFLKKDVQEGNYIATILERIAVSNPGISFKLIRDGKLSFQTPGDGDLKSAIYAVFGKDFTSQLLPVCFDMNGVKVSGFVTKPTACKASRSLQTFFVNGRYVKSVVFFTALEAAYKNSMMVGKYPACVLFVELPFEAVDVNVHPAKTEVRFFEEKKIFDAIYSCTLSAINEDTSRVQASFTPARAFIEQPDKGEQLTLNQAATQNPTPTTGFVIKEFGKPISGSESAVSSPDKPGEKTFDFLSDDYMKPVVNVVSISTDSDSTDVGVDETAPLSVEAPESITETVSTPAEVNDEEVQAVEYKYIGEAFSTYLIAQINDKLVLIDKHAAHERILFEQFKKMGAGESQMMLTPVTITLSADEYSAIIDNLELLAGAGYDVADFGDRTVKISACPPQLVDENIFDIITEIAGYLANNVKSLMPEKLDWIYHSMACRAAVKAGNFTSSYEAERFVGRVLGDSTIRCCPHGRPVLIELTKRELEKQFKRII